MNEPLLGIAQSAIAQCQMEQLSQVLRVRLAIGACVRYGRQQGIVGSELSNEMQAAIEVVVKQAMKTTPETLRCPYCQQKKLYAHVAQCSLRS